MANTSIRVDTVGLGIVWGLGETYRVAIDEGFLEQEGGLQLPLKGNASIMSFSTPANPPQIANTIPTHTSTAPIGIQDISFTIDRSVGNLTVLGGNVFLNRQGSPNVVVRTYVVSNTNTTGNTVSFSVVGNLEASQTYFITSNANIFLDRDGFRSNAITNSNSFRFISPTAPTVTAVTPGNATVASRNFTNVAIDFDRTIFSNTGNLFLHNANTNAVIRTYAISSGLISNNKITLDVVGNIDANGYYYIRSNANVVMDSTQIKYPGLTNASTFTFKAPVSPYLESTVPTNTTTSASRSLTTVSFTLDRTVTALSGNVYLYEQSNPNVVLKTWTIGSNVSFDSNRTFTVTVPQGMLAPTQAYYVTTNANIAKDLTYINFPGISTTGNTFTFTTDVAPLLSNTFPTYGTALDENESNISFTMDRLVSKNVGNVYLYRVDTVNGNSLVKTYDITANTYLLSNTTVNLPITSLLKVMESYYVTSDYDILKDYYTNEKYRGIINSNTFVFTTSVNRSYVGDRFNLLFPDNIPQITETDLGDTYTVTLQLSSSIGQIHALNDNFASPTGWTAATRTYSVTGNKTAVNSTLSNLYFFPYAGITSSATITFTQSKNSTFQKSQVFTLSMSSASPTYLTGGGNTYSIGEDSKFNFMPFYIYPSWNSNCVVMVKSIQSSNVAIDPGKFYANTASGWTNANDGVIYKAFSRPANVAVYNNQIAEVRDIYYWLSSDYTTSFSIDALLGIESSRSGNILTGGTIYSVSNNYDITPETEYSLLTSTTYTEDASTSITLTIDDDDVHPNITYNVQMQQISPDPGLVTGAFTSPGYGTRQWGSINDTQVKSAWSAITYYPPADYNGNVLIGATITKIQSGQANITLASNVAINLTIVATHNEYIFNTSTYGEGLSTIDYDILDQDTNSPTYYVTLNQISPNPSTTFANIIVDSVDYGATWSISGSKSSIVNLPKGFYVYPDYTGNVVFGLTQIKSSYNGNITQASNVAITFTNSGIPAEYSLSGGTYVEDAVRAIDLSITDTDTRFTNYYINVRQISPNPSANVGNIILGSSYGTNVSLYASRATINSLTKTITPPADWTSNIVLAYTQIKSTLFGNIIQADNVAITYTNINSHNEVNIPVFNNVIAYTDVDIILANTTALFSATYSNIQLALLGGVTGSTTIIDSSPNAYTITNTGAVTYSSAVSKTINGTSLYFNGINRLSLSATANLSMPADFTWEVWVYPTEVIRPIISHSAYGRFMLFTNGYYEIGGGGSTLLASGYIDAAPLNEWTHYAVTRENNRLRVFNDGVMQANVAITGTPESSNTLFIGYYPNGNSYFAGYMQDIAYHKGWARYTANFTPDILGTPSATIAITDQAPNKLYNVVLSVADNSGNIYLSNVSQGNTYTISGNINTVNNSLGGNLRLRPGYSDGNLVLNYTQTQTTDNIIQANVNIPFTMYSLPATPTIGTASIFSNTIGNVSATISFTQPFNYSLVNYYTAVSSSTAGVRTGVLTQSTSGNIIVSNLSPGIAYTFRVNATGNYGASPYSLSSNSLTIYTLPDSPNIGTASATSSTSASVSYTAPSWTGGRTITRYTAISTVGNISGYVNTAASGTISVTGLQSNSSYSFQVFATTVQGNSSLSSASNTITTNAGVPHSPTNAIGYYLGNNTANVSFTAPANNGGNIITSYTAVSSPDNIRTILNGANSGNITVTGLSNLVSYTFSVYATNSYGNSAPSNSTERIAIGYDAPDSYFANVQLLLLGGQTVGNTTIIDSSNNNTSINNDGLYAVTYSNAAIRTYSTALAFNGSSKLTVSSSNNNLKFATGDWTWECWMYVDFLQDRGLIGFTTYGRLAILLQPDGEVYVECSDGTNVNVEITGGSYSSTPWNHIAVSRNGNDFRAFLNGTQIGSTVTSSVVLESTRGLEIGTFNGNPSGFGGAIEQLRFTKGIARYTSNFTPPDLFPPY